LCGAERALRDFERQPAKAAPDADRRRAALFSSMEDMVLRLLASAFHERFDKVRQGWPKSPVVPMDKFDLSRLRAVRTLTETLALQQRLVESCLLDRQGALDALASPAPNLDGRPPEKLNLGALLAAERELAEAKSQL